MTPHEEPRPRDTPTLPTTAPRKPIDQVRLAWFRTWNLQPIRIGCPSIDREGESHIPGCHRFNARFGSNNHASIEELDLGTVSQRMQFKALLDLGLPYRQRTNRGYGHLDLGTTGQLDSKRLGSQPSAKGVPILQPDEVKRAINSVGLAWHQAAEEAIEGVRLMEIPVFVGAENGRESRKAYVC